MYNLNSCLISYNSNILSSNKLFRFFEFSGILNSRFYNFCFLFFACDSHNLTNNYPTIFLPFLFFTNYKFFFFWLKEYCFNQIRFIWLKFPKSFQQQCLVLEIPLSNLWIIFDLYLNSYFFNCYVQKFYVMKMVLIYQKFLTYRYLIQIYNIWNLPILNISTAGKSKLILFLISLIYKNFFNYYKLI